MNRIMSVGPGFLCLTFLSVCRSLSASEAVTHLTHNISAKPGDTITLPCTAPPISQDYALPHYVYLYHDGQSDTEKQHKSFRGRVEMKDSQLKDDDLSSTLKDVRRDDNGTYICRVIQSNRKKRDIIDTEPISTITLTVSEPAVRSIPAKPGDTITLPCTAPLISQDYAVQWTRPDLEPDYVYYYRDGWPDTREQHPSFRGRVELKDSQLKDGDLSLSLKDVRRDDNGTYICRVIQSYGKKRDIIDTEPISTVILTLEPGGENKNGGDKRGHVGLVAVVIVSVLLVGFILGGFVIYRKRNRLSLQSYQAATSASSV